MVLHSLQFIMLFSLLMGILLIIQQCFKNEIVKKQLQLAMIGCFSLFFMYKFDWRFCACLIITSLYTYFFGILIDSKTITGNKKTYCILSVTGLVLFLGYFKYANFFLENVNSIIGKETVLLDIILPVGISFYVFSAISYIIDVYKGVFNVERNVFRFSFYMCFFPKVIAGPIVRAKEFLPQIHNYNGIHFEGFNEGIQLFAIGLFKKIVLADRLKVFVDDVFYALVAYDTIFSYALQIYFDFAGYSDMAIGVSKIMGFSIADNFNFPYVANNMSDFWKRWHISLSSWLKDYVYIPLGGGRKGEWRTYTNIMVVMLVSGLWHGARWTFVLWGGTHGLFSCVNVFWNKHIKKYFQFSNESTVFNCFSKLLTFVLVALLWVFFRAESFTDALLIITGAVTIHDGINQMYTWSYFSIACLIICNAYYLKYVNDSVKKGIIKKRFYSLDLNKSRNQIILLTFIGITIILGYYGNNAFIYGRF